MSYRARVEAAILSGTPLLSALWWAINARRTAPAAEHLSAVRAAPLPR